METVSVFARVRPLSAREAREGEGRAVYAQAAHGAVSVASAYGGDGDRAFRFERVFDEDASQGDVFAACCAPLVACALEGTNASILTYGQTGTGKTHTMLGHDVWRLAAECARAAADRTSDGERGLIPRAMACLFGALKRSRARACVKVSYVEIHNERVVDLLRPPDGDGEPAALDIRDDAERGMIALGAEEVEVGAEDQVLDVLWFGAENRAMCATDLNERSSRSHTIFAVAIERLDRDGRLLRSKLNLVDLAGSEKWRSYELKAFSAALCANQPLAARIKELTSINQSLSALANVVGALIAGKAHVPYRASKLTRLLQDSLGGTCKAAFVATMSPCASAAGRETQIFNPTSMSAVEETLSTLHFARRAMKVRVFAAPNVEAADTGGGGGGGARELRNALAVAPGDRGSKVVRQQRRGVAAPDAPSDAPATARRDLAERAALAKAGSGVRRVRRGPRDWLSAQRGSDLPPLAPADMAGASVDLRERVALMEASVLVQSEELATATASPASGGRGATARPCGARATGARRRAQGDDGDAAAVGGGEDRREEPGGERGAGEEEEAARRRAAPRRGDGRLRYDRKTKETTWEPPPNWDPANGT
ncbi:ATP-dependent microtubule motor [Aureococcus anophagefferens]|nr:ATP-dependent microtubule motor [Aureococcus anophagefferens]